MLWKFASEVSWLWWNVIGCLITFSVGYLTSLFFAVPDPAKVKGLTFSGYAAVEAMAVKEWKYYYMALVGYAVFILVVLVLIKALAG
jgi:hypothetical protein